MGGAQMRKNKKKRNGAAKAAAAAEEREDRISRLPDELLFLILASIDTKLAVQTCILSTRWKNLWRTLPNLNFNWEGFHAKTKLSMFVNKFLTRRDQALDISTINFTSNWPIQPLLFKRILRYGFSHGIQHLQINNDCKSQDIQPCLIPISTFRSQSLKHLSLTLASNSSLDICPCHPVDDQTLCPQASIWSPWNLPNLTSLYLHFAPLQFSCNYAQGTHHKSADPFSSLVNLKDLSLINCETFDLNVLHITSISLESLTISSLNCYLWEPQSHLHVVVSAPKLISCNYSSLLPLSISAATDQQQNCLREATISIFKLGRSHYEMSVPRVHEMLLMVSHAEFLAISSGTAELLLGAPDMVNNQASPLRNLKCLTIEVGALGACGSILNRTQAYFLKSSPNASMQTIYTGRPYI